MKIKIVFLLLGSYLVALTACSAENNEEAEVAEVAEVAEAAAPNEAVVVAEIESVETVETVDSAIDLNPVESTDGEDTIVAPGNPDLIEMESTIAPLFDLDGESLSILFVGNSYLAHRPYVDGEQTRYTVFQQLADMIEIDMPDLRYRMHSIGGGTLEEHWEEGKGEGTPRYDIENGDYQLLVIQGRYDILENTEKKVRFDNYADAFAELAKLSNMKVVFYGLWATDTRISPSGGDVFGPAANAIYCDAALRQSAACAPNGIAYGLVYDTLAESMNEEALEDFLTVDRVHPYPPVAYMAANVVYDIVFGEMPPPLTSYRPPTVGDELGQLLRQSAWSAANSHGINRK